MNTVSTLTFSTSSGSVYEIDQREKRIRFLAGKKRHKCFPTDMQWRSFEAMDYLEIGARCVIVFNQQECDYVMTSAVTGIKGQRAA